jgi:6-pyruvoyltetrahydropterin/6-carboxytetrahydropterin synthase
MFRVTKEFHFSASHQLAGLPEWHPCSRLHGHNYIVQVVLAAETLNQVGFVVNLKELKPLKDFLDEKLDHRHLNDVLDMQTSAENIARYLYQWAKAKWPEVITVRVSETPKNWAEYSAE